MLRNMLNAKTATAIALAFGLVTGAAMISPASAADQTTGSPQPAPAGSAGTNQHSGQQTGQQAGQATSGQKGAMESKHYTAAELRGRADQLIGKDVVNRNGSDVGELGNIVVDKQTNQPYAVIEVGGVLGVGEKNVVIPFDELQVSGDKITLMSQKSEDDLKKMPSYNRDKYSPIRESEGSKGTPAKSAK